MLSVFGAMGCAQSDLDHLEAVALDGSSWRYLVPYEQPDSDWLALNFDDLSWSEVVSGFGYGDGDDATVVESTMSIF